MNESEWNELQRVWKSLPPDAEPVAIELERLQRRRHWFAAEIVIEAVIAVAGLGVAGVADRARRHVSRRQRHRDLRLGRSGVHAVGAGANGTAAQPRRRRRSRGRRREATRPGARATRRSHDLGYRRRHGVRGRHGARPRAAHDRGERSPATSSSAPCSSCSRRGSRSHSGTTKHGQPISRGSRRSPTRCSSDRRSCPSSHAARSATARDSVIFAPCTFSTNSPRAASWPTSPIATACSKLLVRRARDAFTPATTRRSPSLHVGNLVPRDHAGAACSAPATGRSSSSAARPAWSATRRARATSATCSTTTSSRRTSPAIRAQLSRFLDFAPGPHGRRCSSTTRTGRAASAISSSCATSAST